jgi:hypothetical protein
MDFAVKSKNDTGFYGSGIRLLPHRWQTVISLNGDYFVDCLLFFEIFDVNFFIYATIIMKRPILSQWPEVILNLNFKCIPGEFSFSSNDFTC